jgi:hypothetical protein
MNAAQAPASHETWSTCEACILATNNDTAGPFVLQELHIIIFDEIDAICRQRGSVRDGTGTHDTIVNQLLTKIDGVDALNNILLIGMTNRCVGRCWQPTCLGR